MNKFKKLLVAGLVCATAVTGGLCLTACGNDNTDAEAEIHQIYDKAVASGYEGTYEEWLASIKGEKGDKGEQGIQGEEGKKVEMNVSSTHIQWRYEGDTEWTDLIALSELKGSKGDTGSQGAQGVKGDTGSKGEKGDAGNDGREVEFNVSSTHIQWRYKGTSSWTNLVALSDLKGAKGDTGAQGAKGDKGDTGAQGIQGEKGDKGETGKSAYEIYCGYKVNYTGSEADWLNDMISGKLILVATENVGDINGDGEVDTVDAGLIQQWLDGEYDGEFNTAIADTDANGVIDERDIHTIQAYVVKKVSTLPLAYKWGDVNLDGKVDEKDYNLLNNETSYNNLTDTQKYLATFGLNLRLDQSKVLMNYYFQGKIDNFDILWGNANGDGKVNAIDLLRLAKYLNGWDVEINLAADVDLNGKVDYADLRILTLYLAKWFDSLPVKYKWGDVNEDGVVDQQDLTLLTQYVNGENVTINKVMADIDFVEYDFAEKAGTVSGDVNIDERDVYVLRKYLSGAITSLPLDYAWGDINLDGKVDEDDYNLLNSEESYNSLNNLQKCLASFGYDYSREVALPLFRQYLDGEIETMAPATDE